MGYTTPTDRRFLATRVMINGTNFGTLQNDPAVYFNGSGVQPSSWTNTQIVATVPMGARTGPLIVKAGYASSSPTNFTIVPTGSQGLSITPANETLFIGQSVNFLLNDNLEHNITGATWTLSNNNFAQLSTADAPVLAANEAGTGTVTATSTQAVRQDSISQTGIISCLCHLTFYFQQAAEPFPTAHLFLFSWDCWSPPGEQEEVVLSW
ncbi:MAG: IPT/TIG domain-containing protein [Candidatus Sulfotelmatobacter sp.]